ncbi:hypothetical protein Dda_7445 [Drechslerella dactyloides]|uniref:Uncharacterized protein n=1 Tax=Drechslerella dactyloides TaxID=74499 RepID=A0AAD6IS59_DREDA|nr:hypothetical protein Dda_7445 [Drechslerella dactyloides]
MPRLPVPKSIVNTVSKRHHSFRKITVAPKTRQNPPQTALQQQSILRPASKEFKSPAAAYQHTIASHHPPTEITIPPGQSLAPSAAALLNSLNRCGIRVSPTGSKMITRVLHDIPYDGIDLFWIRRIEMALRAVKARAAASSTENLYVTARTAGPAHISSREWAARQVDMLARRLLSDPAWYGLFDVLVFDDGVRHGVEGEVELKAVLEMMLRSRWILPLGEYGGVYQAVVKDCGRVRRTPIPR